MLSVLCQPDPALGPLPGFDPVQWAAPRIQAASSPAGPYLYHGVPSTTDAVAWTVLDLKLLQAVDPSGIPFYRWIWLPPMAADAGNQSWLEANSLVVNSACSQSSLIVLPEVTAGGYLIRWDLRKLAPKADDLRRLLVTWNALAIQEPYFHVQLPIVNGVQTVAHSDSYVHIDGKTYHSRAFVPAPHVADGYSLLERDTSIKGAPSFAPLVRADDFLRRVSSTLEGGLYYHFLGAIRDGHRLDEREIFKLVGLDVLISRKVEGDDRAAVFQSGVTGKPRTVEQVQGAVGRARITYDLTDADVDASRHAIYNLLDGVDRAKAKEIIFERPNGTFGYLLSDGKGKLVDVAPPDVASDHRVPAPHTAQLQPMISCIRCHGLTGGVQAVRNDVATLLGGGTGEVDLFDDLSSKAGRFATVDRIAGLYAAGDQFTTDLADSRNSYADAVFRATKGSGPRGPVGVVEKAHENVAAQYANYFYGKSLTEANVNADSALLGWGIRCKPGEGNLVLRQLMPARRADVVIDGRSVEFADPALEALKRGLSIRRQDENRIHALGAYLIQQNRGDK